MSPIGGLFQIINLWMIYLCYASMHFCQTLFVAFFFILEDFTSLGFALKVGAWYYWLMLLYNIVSTFVLWRGFMIMHKEQAPQGNSGGGFRDQESGYQ